MRNKQYVLFAPHALRSRADAHLRSATCRCCRHPRIEACESTHDIRGPDFQGTRPFGTVRPRCSCKWLDGLLRPYEHTVKLGRRCPRGRKTRWFAGLQSTRIAPRTSLWSGEDKRGWRSALQSSKHILSSMKTADELEQQRRVDSACNRLITPAFAVGLFASSCYCRVARGLTNGWRQRDPRRYATTPVSPWAAARRENVSRMLCRDQPATRNEFVPGGRGKAP
ncbi:hypothetical protein AWB81_08274 [Caballeronia arationis]|uniref:Uncharacterized protein n=1 Tax=Caballeronia arationis TaxID=1777142 RepID=A0A7Z7I3N3_9BURK|nr:hypothetical protein AWB81_08274 [Caballeronia arationis]SOE56582.1 hypothetical protein SAMN05446927_1277 [Caballeronia arationis]